MSVGTFFVLASGAPLNELEGSSIGFPAFDLAQPRGAAGRRTTIWGLNFRFTYGGGRPLAEPLNGLIPFFISKPATFPPQPA